MQTLAWRRKELREEVVTFLGPKASYTHQMTINHVLKQSTTPQAAKLLFPGKGEKEIVPQNTIEDVFAAVQAGTATQGIVPFENSSNGSVIFTLDLFANTAGLYPDIVVEGELYMPVHHYLLGHIRPKSSSGLSTLDALSKMSLNSIPESPTPSGQVTPTQSLPTPARPRATPAYPLKHIQKLYSHPQAWGQCKIFLSTYLKHAERQDVSSTSKAAELVAMDETGTSAAVSSKLAAQLNGLDVLAEEIEDSESNSTRFFVLCKRRDSNSSTHTTIGPTPAANATDTAVETKPFKSLVSFTVDHASPGALADSLAVFKKYNLNLTSINTRPSVVTPWQYIFFVEFMGRKRGDDEGGGGAVNKALEELGEVASGWRWLGSWESMKAER